MVQLHILDPNLKKKHARRPMATVMNRMGTFLNFYCGSSSKPKGRTWLAFLPFEASFRLQVDN